MGQSVFLMRKRHCWRQGPDMTNLSSHHGTGMFHLDSLHDCCSSRGRPLGLQSGESSWVFMYPHVGQCGGGTSNSYRNWHWRQVEDTQSPRHPSRKSRPFPSSAWECCVAWQVPRFLQLVLAKASEHCISTYYNQVSVYLRVGDTLDAKYEVPHARTFAAWSGAPKSCISLFMSQGRLSLQ